MHKMRGLLIILLGMVTATVPAQWRSTDGPSGGTVLSVAVEGSRVFAGTQAGLYISDDNGSTWNESTTGWPCSRITAIALNNATAVAGIYGEGIIRSTDHGDSWIFSNEGLTNLSIHCISFCGNRLLAGTDAGMFQSVDIGLTWSRNAQIPANLRVTSLSTRGSSLFAGTYGNGVYRSDDSGVTWTIRDAGLTNRNVLSMLWVSDTAYAGTDGGGVYRLAGDGWLEVNEGLPALAAVAALTEYSGKEFAAVTGQGIFATDNNGGLWYPSMENLDNREIHCLAAGTQKIFAGSEGGGVFLSSGEGMNWAPAGKGITASAITAILTGTNEVFACTRGAGLHHSPGNGYAWQSVSKGLTCPYPMDISGFGGLLVTGTLGAGIFFSADNANNWYSGNNGPSNPYVTNVIGKEGILFAGTRGGGVFASSDTGKSWIPVNTGLTDGVITTLVGSGEHIYAGTYSSGIFRTGNNGDFWEPCGAFPQGKQVNGILTIGAEIYAGTSTGMYHSTDSGSTWGMVTGFPACPVPSLAFTNGTLFAATTGRGMQVSDDGGEHWNGYNTGLVDSSLNVIALSDMNIQGGTNAKGMWMRALSDFFRIEIAPDTVRLGWQSGSPGDLIVDSKVEWTLQGFLPIWLTVNKKSGTGSDTLTFRSTAENTGTVERKAILYLFSAKAKMVSVMITQRGRSQGISCDTVGDLVIGPNPVAEILWIRNRSAISRLRMCNALGEVVWESPRPEKEFGIDVSRFSPGLYSLTAFFRDSEVTRKIIIRE
ncbi:MAG TPA: hypothetical protein PLK82_02755 [Bacteroidales bacterium]|nr:hypothetical protein [Bacteroidales bacterium]